MEYINGITLKEYIEQKDPLDWKEAINISIQICLAIEHAHKNHIVHRDIKPHNILITKDGVAKVTDIGIARAVTSSTITMAGSTKGSVHYFSPEQARGGFTDEKSDLYSIGIVMYEMMTGELPFNGESPVAVALKHIQDEPKEPLSLRSDLPKGINSIIMRAIKKDQTKRYQSVSELLQHLYKVLNEPEAEFLQKEDIDSSPTVRMPSIGDKEIKTVDDSSTKGTKAGDEKMKKKKKKKKDRMTTIIAVAASLVIIIVAVVMFSNFISGILERPEDFVVEDYTGKNYDDVKKQLEEMGITVNAIIQNNDVYKKDTIINQDKATGERLRRGAVGYNTIEFVVSDGPLFIKVPDLRGHDYRDAQTTLRLLGLESEIQDDYSDTVTTNYVIKTEPDTNYDVRPGGKVTIYKSLGPEIKQVEVPDLTGLTRSEAFNRLSYKGLAAGETYPQQMTSYILDKVVSQSPISGTMVDEGTPVDIHLQDINPDLKKIYKVIVLDDKDYQENIRVLVNATRSDTNNTDTLMTGVVKKSDFPITVQVSVPNGGSTQVKVYLNSKIYMDFTERF